MFRKMLFDMLTMIILSVLFAVVFLIYMTSMPGQSYQGAKPTLDQEGLTLIANTKAHIESLSRNPMGRNLAVIDGLTPAKEYIIQKFTEYGYTVSLQNYELEQKTFTNISAELSGQEKAAEIIVIGAHYDSVDGSPGANDNASGVAALLEIARLFKQQSVKRTIQFVAFANEESPFFQTTGMGSFVYATQLADQQEKVVAMLALETIGYYTETPNSQAYPAPLHYFYPTTGNFIGFVGQWSARSLVKKVVGIFRQHATLPSEGAALPSFIPGVDFSDHWAFSQYRYPALMITDTAPFRYPFYHTAQDTPDKIDYEKMVRVILGLKAVIIELAVE